MNSNQNNPADPFARLKAIAANQNTNTTTTTTATQQTVRFWNYPQDGDIIGTIIGFSGFNHPQFGEQHTVIVQLADTEELVSAILNNWLQEGLCRQQANVGDLILIQFQGKDPVQGFNRFFLKIEKPQPQPLPQAQCYSGQPHWMG